MIRLLTLFVIVSITIHVNGQEDSLKTLLLEDVEVKAARIALPAVKQPFSVATYQATTLQETRQQLSLQEYLSQIPGLFSLNANNYAQDLRVSIRGFGARAAFGIRGVKIVVDGIPETTPDGQGQIDNLNIGVIDRLEVLKGPSAALYGNASGGVIQIYTKDHFDKNFLSTGLTFGAFGMQQYQLGGGFGQENTKVMIQGTHTRTEGYREQSNLENTNLNARLFHTFSDKAKLNLQFNYTNSPTGDDPGGINQASVEENRRQARDRNVLLKTGEAIQQLKLGGQYQYQLDATKSIQFYGFYSNRDFEGRIPVPFNGWIALQRNYFGQGGHFKIQKPLSKGTNTFQVGYEWASQQDDRTRFANNEGSKGDLRLDQIESFSSLGFYALNHYSVNRWLFSLGIRYDNNQLETEDQKLDNGDQSGIRKLSTVNPSIGFNYEVGANLHLYGSFRTSFETPVLNELSNNPSGGGGFNEELKSQTASNYEVGIKGLLGNKVDFDLTYFHIDTQNDIVPYEIDGQDFFRNAGSTTRDGIELWLRYQLNRQLFFRGSYTYSNFSYKEYVVGSNNFSGNELPGLTPHLLALQLAYENDKGLNIRIQHRSVASFFANDANSETAIEPTYQVTDLSCSYRIKWKESALIPFLGINNIFDTDYSDNIRINAFGSRFYEPAAGTNVYGGIRLRLKN